MRVSITSGASELSQQLAGSLSPKHEITLTDRRHVATSHRFVRSELGHDEASDSLVRGIEAVVHLGAVGAVDPAASASDHLDVAMRCTYNLLWAAAGTGVRRFVFLSSLRLLDGYDPTFAVTESWRPVPTTDVTVLCHHLGEYVCREFAREGRIQVVCLRLGEITPDDAVPPTNWSSALYADDAVAAVELALQADLPVVPGETKVPSWRIFHIQSDVPRARYITRTAQDTLAFTPARRMP